MPQQEKLVVYFRLLLEYCIGLSLRQCLVGSGSACPFADAALQLCLRGDPIVETLVESGLCGPNGDLEDVVDPPLNLGVSALTDMNRSPQFMPVPAQQCHRSIDIRQTNDGPDLSRSNDDRVAEPFTCDLIYEFTWLLAILRYTLSTGTSSTATRLVRNSLPCGKAKLVLVI